MARAMAIVLITICCALLLMAFIPQTTLIEQPTGYFLMEVKQNPGMTISRHYFTPEEEAMVNAKIHGEN